MTREEILKKIREEHKKQDLYEKEVLGLPFAHLYGLIATSTIL